MTGYQDRERRPPGARLKYAEFRSRREAIKEAEQALRRGDCESDWFRYHLCKGDGWWLTAEVSLDRRAGNHESPSITVFFQCQGRRLLPDWDELTSDQLMKVVELRREIERWENDQRDDLPDPRTWNGGE